MSNFVCIISTFLIWCLCVANSFRYDLEDDTEKNSCILPNHPSSGSWSVLCQPSGRLSPGVSVPEETVIKIKCKKGYSLQGAKFSYCEKGKWSSEIGKCQKLCPKRVSTLNVKVTCFYNDVETENCTHAADGTLAEYKCAPFYETIHSQKSSLGLCKNGSWNSDLPKCVPVCGEKKKHPQESLSTAFDSPWNVAVYKNRRLTCSGSLISTHLILTAAHCVTTTQNEIIPKENFIVVAGKTHRQFDHIPDLNDAQFSGLSTIFIPKQYKSEIQNYYGDIAVLELDRPFILSANVQPVCLDFNARTISNLNQYGYVTSWNFAGKDTKILSNYPQEAQVSVISGEECERTMPQDFRYFLTDDKICVNYLTNDTSLCKGSSGEGLVYKRDNRYYIGGIASVSLMSPNGTDACDYKRRSLYTSVSYYMDKFILDKMLV